MSVGKYLFQLKEVEERPILAIRVSTKPGRIGNELQEILPEVWNYAKGVGATLAGPPFTMYHKMESDEVEIEAGMQLTESREGEGEIRSGTLPAGKVASTVHMGSYENLPDAYRALENWIREQNLKPASPPWEVY